ncbi:MAG: IclR family transcriptional regulator [Acidobacteria bacterium]|nr:IclR family transcriptional regulator [Acidobacteriota bacterium]
MPDGHYIELVGKVVRVAETLRFEPSGLSLQDLANRTGYVKSSVHRILQSLKRHGYIEQDAAGGKYRLGIQFLVLATGLVSRMELVKMGQPYLEELVERFNENAYLAELHRGKGIFVDVHEAPSELRLTSPRLAEVHFHATAAGKAIAAFLPDEVRAAMLHDGNQRALTVHTKTDPDEIERDWSEVRRAGYAINDEETVLGAAFLAAPLFDSRMRVCGSISVGVPKARFSPTLAKDIAVYLVDACRRFSEKLSATGYVHITGS